MSCKFICLLLLPLMLAGNTVMAEIIDVGNCDTPGDANSVFVAGDFAYIADIHLGLRIFDISGRQPANLVNGHQRPGNYNVNFNADKMPSGLYFVRLETSEHQFTRKVMLIR